MNLVDLTLLLVFLLALWAGFHRGFLLATIDLLSWIGSFVLGYLIYQHTADLFKSWFPNLGVWLLPVSFLVTAAFARVLLGFIATRIIRLIPEQRRKSSVNNLLGIIPGAINGWISTIILSALLLALPLRDSITNETRTSKMAVKLAVQSEWANKKLAPVFDQAVRQTMNSLTVHPASHEKVDLNFTYDKPITRPYLEMEMLELVNKERAKEGLKALKADPQLAKVARAHSVDMFHRGYFAHENPDGLDPFDRMKKANIDFMAAGENLALAQTLEIAHINLMNSPGHRANIMNPKFGRLGIGVLDGGFYGLMISQEFRD